MEMQAISVPGALSGCHRKKSGAARLTLALPLLVAAAIATAIQSLWLPIDADVSWLITVAERVLGGDRLYIDIVEVNPPASVWLYVPLVWAAQLLDLRPEAVVVAAFILAAFGSVAATVRLASRLGDAPPTAFLAGGLAFVTLVLPMALFGQREHAALLLAIPAVAALALVAHSRPLGRTALFASGFAAGLVIVIKPHFLLAILVPAIWAAYRRGSLSPLLPGIVAATLAVCAYGAAIFVFARAYLDWVPVIAATYGAIRAPLWTVIVGPALYPVICLGLVALLRSPRIPPLSVAWALAALGFLLAAFIQGKNYPNHWLPQAGLALAAALPVLAVPGIARARVACVAVGLTVVALCEMYYWAIRPDPAVAAAIERVAPAAPKIIALSPQLTTGHPVTRNVGGKWVGSRAGQFTASGARVAGLDSKTAFRAYREDMKAFATDVGRSRPDVILVHPKTRKWLMSDPAIAAAMRAYDFASAAGETEIWLRRERAR
jgi:hypothetical protein